MMLTTIELYTDGSCLGNPGPGGLGYIIRYWEAKKDNGFPEAKIIEGKQGFRLSTNNRMEIMAGIYGIQDILKNVQAGQFDRTSQINLTTDSKYFCDAINQRWLDKWRQNNWVTLNKTPVKNRDLWEQLIGILDQLRSLSITLVINHINGHRGHEFNEMADRLAVSASSSSNDYLIDEVYEKLNKR